MTVVRIIVNIDYFHAFIGSQLSFITDKGRFHTAEDYNGPTIRELQNIEHTKGINQAYLTIRHIGGGKSPEVVDIELI